MTELVGGVFSPGFPGTQSFAGLLGMRKGRREADVGTSAVTCVGSSVVGPRLGSRRGLSWSEGLEEQAGSPGQPEGPPSPDPSPLATVPSYASSRFPNFLCLRPNNQTLPRFQMTVSRMARFI